MKINKLFAREIFFSRLLFSSLYLPAGLLLQAFVVPGRSKNAGGEKVVTGPVIKHAVFRQLFHSIIVINAYKACAGYRLPYGLLKENDSRLNRSLLHLFVWQEKVY